MTHRPIPVLSADGERRQARLADARLAIVSDGRRVSGDLEAFLAACCEGSADVLLLRDKTATEQELRAAAATFRLVADRFGALFVLNDLPGLAADVGADGVHVGQHDVHPDHARHVVGADLVVGRTVHDAEQLAAAADEDVDYLAVGPVLAGWHPGQDPAGLSLVAAAARHAPTPWFAAGGVTAATVADVLASGARRIAVIEQVDGPDRARELTWAFRRELATCH